MKTLQEIDYQNAAKVLNIEIALIKAVADVESTGVGFIKDGGDYDGYPKILFEGHKFHEYTHGKFDYDHETISYPKWTRKYYLGGSAEYRRLNLAKSLDLDAALKSTSWGKFQIMGFNFLGCGYKSVLSFVHDMHLSEGVQLMAFINLIKYEGWDVYLRLKDFGMFAYHYNGAGYKANDYDTKLQKAYKKFYSKKWREGIIFQIIIISLIVLIQLISIGVRIIAIRDNKKIKPDSVYTEHVIDSI